VSVIERKPRPSRGDLRAFGPILAVWVAAVGAVALFRYDAPRVAAVLWIVGAPFPLLYFAVPALRIPMYQGYMRLFFPLGWLVSHAVLAVLFYGIVTPVALLLRLLGRDPLKRRWDRSAASYWTEHRTGGDASRYLRQF
jgi:Saxitoxin biosynthesis operon protein SxtJ